MGKPVKPEVDSARRIVSRRWQALALVLPLAACAGAPTGQFAQPPSVEISTETLMRLGDVSRNGGNLAAAAGFYRRAHERAPERPEPLAALGATFARMGATGPAVDAYRGAIAAGPANADARRGLGNVLLERNEPAQAIVQFEAALAQRPDARALNGLGIAHDLLGDHVEAQAHYRRALDLAGRDPQVLNNLGLSLALSGQYDAAIALLEELVRDPRATPRFRQNLALAYGLAGRPAAARQLGQHDLDPESVQRNLGYYELLRALADTGAAAGAIGAHAQGEGS